MASGHAVTGITCMCDCLHSLFRPPHWSARPPGAAVGALTLGRSRLRVASAAGACGGGRGWWNGHLTWPSLPGSRPGERPRLRVRRIPGEPRKFRASAQVRTYLGDDCKAAGCASSVPEAIVTRRRDGLPRNAALDRAYVCPILGADWERRSAARCGQKRSDAITGARSMGLTCWNVPELGPCSPARLVVVLGVGGSSPLAHPIESRAEILRLGQRAGSGGMGARFWLRRKRLPGSKRDLSAASRAYFSAP
jgi:hypothetical protein